MDQDRRRFLSICGVGSLGWLWPDDLRVKLLAAEAEPLQARRSIELPRDSASASDPRALLSDQDFARIEKSIDRALEFILPKQRGNGGFRVYQPSGEPAITCLSIMAMLARGHQPGRGPYGRQLEKAIDYVLDCQHPDGMLAVVRPEPEYVALGGSHNVNYNQGIAGLMLSEVFGMTTPDRDKRIQGAIHKALAYCVRAQLRQGVHDGGWGYDPPINAHHATDLSVVSWNVMFLRSAKNIGFEVPMESITRNMEYLDRSYWPQDGGFRYHLFKPQSCASMSAVGIAMLSLGGHRDSEKIETAAKYLVSNPWSGMGAQAGEYAAYYIGLAALHLGEPYWSQLYPPILATIFEAQQPDGSWPLGYEGEKFSPVYTTAMYALTLAVPLQLLPIYQP